jgi:hypothetical protein
MYVNYEYYKNTYKGDLTKEEFDKILPQSQLAYDNYIAKPHLTNELLEENKQGAYAIRYTLCEMVDNINRYNELISKAQANDLSNALGITSESVKDHSISLKTGDTLKSNMIEEQLLLSNAKIMRKHLLIYNLLGRTL